MKFLVPFGFCNFLFRVVTSYNLETSYPIIYEIPAISDKVSYFGISVAIRPKAASLNNTWTIQIGAPRSGNTGKVYRCHTYGPCHVYELDKKLSTFGGYGIYEFKEKKDEAWIGVAMDIKSSGSQERSVVCGHRWMNQNLKNPENIDVTYLMTGVCYLQILSNDTSEMPVQRLFPLINKDKIYTPKPYVADLSTYHWGLGQAGFSVTLLEQYSKLLIGAPGMTHWMGGVIKYEEYLDVVIGNFARSEISRKSRYLYSGYSVAFGRFYKDKEIWNVAGAPRSANYRGQVFTFQFKDSFGDVSIQSSILGTTFGEYFGSSLATGDLNSDGYDDLIAGAPLFSSKDFDEGRIYVYLGTGRGNFLEAAQVINGRVDQGRFGTCITFIKDLDQDGYSDVAVGAPYENDKKGAVYIYRGFSKGLQTDYSQRICAQDIHPHLRGFGISISPATDIDGNKYLDIAVGAYLSDHVVLIRSRPIISLHPNVKTENKSLIDRKDSYFNVTVCSRYSGSNAPHFVDIVRTFEIDPIHSRGMLDTKTSLAKKLIRLRTNQIVCEIHPIILNFSKRNFSPLQITLKEEIYPCVNNEKSSLFIKGSKSEGVDGFLKTCPIGNKAEVSKEIPFAGICGSDLLCISDLELLCDLPDFRGISYILGSIELIGLAIKVINHGEPAYDTRIKISSNLKLKHFNKKNDDSSNFSKNIHWVDLEGLLVDNFQTNFSFQIDFDALEEKKGETRLSLMLEIFTTSVETNSKNNHCKLSLNLVSDTVLAFRAFSSISTIYITKATLQAQILKATHYYEVQKNGVTPLKEAELTIYIPYYFEKEFLNFEIANTKWMHFSDLYEKKAYKKSESGDVNRIRNKKNCPPTNRTLFLNCSTERNHCKIQKIFFMKGIPNGLTFYIKILISLNVTAIDSVKKEKDIVHFSTTGVLKFSKFLEMEPKELQKSVSITLYNEEHELNVNAHHIMLSFLAGVFLFSLIVIALANSNFFKRSKKHDLKILKDANAFFVSFPMGSNSQTT